MDNENHGKLEQIFIDTVRDIQATGILNLDIFIKQMEDEFVRLGYREKSAGVKNILLVRLDAVGDFMMTTPSIRTVRENFPTAHITLLVTPRTYSLAELCPYVNEVLSIEIDYFELQNFFKALQCIVDFAKKNLWKNFYDLCFYFGGLGPDGEYMRSFLPYLSGARERIGYNYDIICKSLDTLPVTWRPKEIRHECLRALYLLQAYGLKVNDTRTEVWFDKLDLNEANKILNGFGEGRVKIAVGIGASTLARIYPPDKYIIAFREIIAEGAALVLFGGKEDELILSQFFVDHLPKGLVKNTVPLNISWRTTAAIISQLDMYIGNDTGPKHIAAALKKPVIYLSRVAKDTAQFVTNKSTEVEMFYPWQTETIVLQPEHQLGECEKKHLFIGCIDEDKPHCITQIEPAEIVDAYEKILQSQKSY